MHHIQTRAEDDYKIHAHLQIGGEGLATGLYWKHKYFGASDFSTDTFECRPGCEWYRTDPMQLHNCKALRPRY